MNILNTGSATLINSLAVAQDISSPQAYKTNYTKRFITHLKRSKTRINYHVNIATIQVKVTMI